MSVGVLAIIVFLGVPVLVGFIAGLGGVVSSTKGIHPHATPAWRHTPDYAKEGHPEKKKEEKDYDPYSFDWGHIEDRKEESFFELKEETKPSLQHTMAYENSLPSVEMNGAIDELLKAIGGPVLETQNDAAECQTTTNLSDVEHLLNEVEGLLGSEVVNWPEEFKHVQMATIVEPETELVKPERVIAEEAFEGSVQPLVEQPDNLIYFPVDYAPTPLAFDEYRAIERRYGSEVAQAITTTPGQGSSGKSDVMLGQLEHNSVGYVLSYGDFFIPLKGDVPKQFIGKAVLLLGQFISQEEFYVLEWDDPEAIAHRTTAPFSDSGSQLTAAL
ncbi:hypothetical protein ACFPOG_20645 [Paenibacillus aestuarii]|uniref:Uncharacterized protein n=1 Tax=Paenibacillus aestuarii TaxID=516965 RepID=A0ABW0KBK6_9BACL